MPYSIYIFGDGKSQFHRISLCAVAKEIQSCQTVGFYSFEVIAGQGFPHQWHVMEQ